MNHLGVGTVNVLTGFLNGLMVGLHHWHPMSLVAVVRYSLNPFMDCSNIKMIKIRDFECVV